MVGDEQAALDRVEHQGDDLRRHFVRLFLGSRQRERAAPPVAHDVDRGVRGEPGELNEPLAGFRLDAERHARASRRRRLPDDELGQVAGEGLERERDADGEEDYSGDTR